MKPYFDREKNITIVLASSAYYVPYMDVTIKSIVETSNQQYGYDIVILHKQISEDDQNRLKLNEKKNVSVRFARIDQELDAKEYNYRPGYAPESFYRVVMPYILNEYDNAIWLDCDVIVKKDISEMYREALACTKDKCIAACKDIDGMASCVCNHEDRLQYMHTVLGLSDIKEYLQSGVMFFNFLNIRHTYSLDELIDASCNPKIMYGDQDVLNYLYNGKIHYLEMSWNTITNSKFSHMETLLLLAPISIVDEYLEARRHPYIIHLASKPWKDPTCEYAEEFWELARKSKFYDEIISRWGQED